MSDIDRIKDRIRKLMAYANDGAASNGEIENAMGHAAKLIDAHHLNPDEFKDQPGQTDPDNITFAEHGATSQSERFSTWESTLATSVKNLFGCVGCYISGDTAVIRRNGVAQTSKDGEARRGRRVVYYGPDVEAREASELFSEWSHLIATMGVVRWGGCFRGDGAQYCYGFTVSLYNQSLKIQDGRQLVSAKAPALLAHTGSIPSTSTAITLKGRYDMILGAAKEWAEERAGCKFTKRSRGGGYSGSSSAFSEGKSHGAAAGFGRREARRQLPGA